MKSKLKLTKRLRIPSDNQEKYLKECGFEVIAGVDEVGRGAWAGPLVAAAVILDKKLYGLRDSKLLTGKEREKLNLLIRNKCRIGIGEVSVEEIDLLKMTKATQLAFKRAIDNLGCKIDYALIDGTISLFNSPLLYPERAEASRMGCRAIKKGDMTCSSIAAASIVAKVYRDKLMTNLDRKIKGYHFSLHKGYGTKLHQTCLKKLGVSIVHRKSFGPIKKLKKTAGAGRQP